MGPDCGTAIIGGKSICFANAVRRGPVGIVAASGTGLQELTCLVDEYGSGISEAIGTGGRDLKNEQVGGMTTLAAIEALKIDPATEVVVVISKPPADEVAANVLAALEACGKPAVVHFLGYKGETQDRDRVAFASNLEETARIAVTFASGAKSAQDAKKTASKTSPDMEAIRGIAARESGKLAKNQRYLRGLFVGGTLTDEALFLAHAALGRVRSNNQIDEAWLLQNPAVSAGHTIVDLGDDFFTVGKPHPMIDPSPRAERIVREGCDPETAVLLLDFVIGYGSHDDPAGAALKAISQAKAEAAAMGGYLPVVASVTGTRLDPQDKEAQTGKLREAGVIVMESNYRSALVAIEIAKAASESQDARSHS
jgi:succinyl-CoA synthetase alpha subunit